MRNYSTEEHNIKSGLERIAIVEERILHVLERIEGLNEQQLLIQTRLDEILEIKHKGMGAFWLAASLMGSGLISFVWVAIDWVKGHA